MTEKKKGRTKGTSQGCRRSTNQKGEETTRNPSGSITSRPRQSVVRHSC